MILKMTNIPEPELNTSDENVAALAQVFKLLGDENRLRIVLHVSHRERSVVELCELLGIAQPLVSHHLGLLRSGGLLNVRREGKHNYYSVRQEHFERLMKVLFRKRTDRPPCGEFSKCMFDCENRS